MLVDDHALLRSAVRHAIDAPGIEVVAEAASAEEALTRAIDVRPDVILVDIDLPGMDGIRLVRELSPRLPDARIVMLTVSDSDRDAFDAVRAGATGYLTKNLTPEELLRSVRAAGDGELVMSGRMAGTLVRRLVRATQKGPSGSDGDGPTTGLESLSSREHEILRLLAQGLTDREIAEALVVSPRTVESHVSSILHKLHARNRSEAAARYRAG